MSKDYFDIGSFLQLQNFLSKLFLLGLGGCRLPYADKSALPAFQRLQKSAISDYFSAEQTIP